MTVLWIDPSFGASGDMFLGALSGLLGDEAAELLETGLGTLGVEGYSLTSEMVTRNGISARRVGVSTERTEHARRWSDIDVMLANTALSERVQTGARATFRRLGLTEAAQHNVELEDVHFHEVGAIDAIVDIVGTWILFDELVEQFEITHVATGPVGLGHGTVNAAHGTLPLPAPATASLLMGMAVKPLDTATETCTPTGAALLAELSQAAGPLPAGVLRAVARGAGGRNPDTHPNVLSVYVVEDTRPAPQAIVLATNIDDATPEVLANTIRVLLDAGADDAWLVPIVMKKGRQANELRVLCTPGLSARLRVVMHLETGTLGIREEAVHKHVLDRSFEQVTVRDQPIMMKVSEYGAKPEFDDLERASIATGIPVRQLSLEAHEAFRIFLRSSNG